MPPEEDARPLANLVSRRKFLRFGGAVLGVTAVGGAGGLLDACSKKTPTTGGSPSAGASSPAKKLKVRIAYTASAFPSIVNNRAGPLQYGPQFGLDITDNDLQQFNDSSTATQAVLSGQADVVSGSFLSALLLIQQGQPFKCLCSVSNGNDLLMLGQGPITSIDKVTSDQAIVAIDSPGGLINLIYNAMLAAHNINVNVESLKHTKVFGDSPPRTQSFLSKQTNVAVVHNSDLPKVDEALGKDGYTILSTLWEDVHGMVFEVMAASTDWIEKNMDVATALMKAVCTGNRELAKDYNKYKAAIDKFIPGSGLSDADLKPLWELARKSEFWPYNGDLEDQSVTFTEQVGNNSGVLKGTMTSSQVVDRRPLDAALKDIGSVTVADITA